MKRLFFAFTLMLCLSTFLCSCEKGGAIDEKRLEGRWWVPDKGELLLNGKVVDNEPLTDIILDYKVYFEDGNYTCVDLESGDSFVFGYSFIDGVLRIGVMLGYAIELFVNRITKNEGVVDIYVQNVNPEIEDSSLLKAAVIDTYMGTEIYSYTFLGIFVYTESLEYWYYNNKGEKVPCTYGEHTSIREWNEEKGVYETKDSFDFWYDTERFYFKAE